MRIFLWLGMSLAFAMTSVATRAETPADEPVAQQPAALPDAFDSMVAPPADDVAAQNTPDIGSQLVIATHQLETKEFSDAAALLGNVVAELERSTSRYDPSLVAPLTMLGDAFAGEEKYKEALLAYERARHITRVTNGLHATEQIDLLYRESDAYQSMGKFDKANDFQEYAYETLLNKYGPVSQELIPGLYRLAAWYERTSNVFAARVLYQRAVDILERSSGPNSPELIRPLRGLAKTYKDERFPLHDLPEDWMPGPAISSASSMYQTGTLGGTGSTMVVNRFGPGEVALLQVVKIVGADPASSPLDLALAELDLADWYLLFEKESRAMPVYVHARQIMRERASMTDEQIAAYFGQPVLLYRSIPDGPAKPPEPLNSSPKEGHVELGYTVNARGQVDDLKTLSSEPDGMMDLKVRRGMRAARFRPKFEGDSPVESLDQVYRYTFTYYPRPGDLPKETDEASEPEAAKPTG